MKDVKYEPWNLYVAKPVLWPAVFLLRPEGNGENGRVCS